MASYNSFYGGRRGASFVIVKSYFDVPSMVQDFQQGNGFTEVLFDEYVIINNPNRKHPDNGKIFRRGHDFNSDRTISCYRTYFKIENPDWENNQQTESRYIAGEEVGYPLTLNQYEGYVCDNQGIKIQENGQYKIMPYEENGDIIPYPYLFIFDSEYPAHGAEYVGSMIGPEGKAPHLTLAHWDAVEHTISDSPYPGKELQSSNGSYFFGNGDLIPGKYEEEGIDKYNDEIYWISASLRDYLERDTLVQIGFKIPYLITEMQTQAVQPYAPENGYKGILINNQPIEQGHYADTSEIINLIDNTQHPFYNKWHLKIPNGIKGDSITNVRVVTVRQLLYDTGNSNTRNVQRLIPYSNNENENQVSFDYISESYTFPEIVVGKEDQIQVVACSTTVYDNLKQGQTQHFFLGYFTQLKEIEFNENKLDGEGHTLTNEEGQILGDGKVRFIFTGLDKDNHDRTEFEFNYIKSLNLAENGIVTFKKASNDIETLDQKIKWINHIELGKEYEIYVTDIETPVEGWTYDQIQTRIDTQRPISYSIARGATKADDRYFIKNITKGIPSRLTQSELIIIDSEGNVSIKYSLDSNGNEIVVDDTEGDDLQNRAKLTNESIKPWNNVNGDYNSFFTNLQQGQLAIQFNTESQSNVKDEYRTIIPYVSDFSYDKGTGLLTYRRANNETSELGEFIYIKDIKLDNYGNLKVQVNTIPSEKLQSDEYGIISQVDGDYLIDNENNKSYLIAGHLKAINNLRITTQQDIQEEISELTAGLEEPYPQEIQTKITEIRNKINKLEVIYQTDPNSDDISSEVLSRSPLLFLSSFEYDQEHNQLVYSFNENDPTRIDLPVISWVGYNKETGKIEFRTGDRDQEEGESTEIPGGDSIPFIRKVGYNATTKDFFVQFNREIKESSEEEEDSGEIDNEETTEEEVITKEDVVTIITGKDAELTNDGWVKIGNLATYPTTPLPATNLSYSNLASLIPGGTEGSNSTLINKLLDLEENGSTAINLLQNDPDYSRKTTVEALNLIFKDGLITYSAQGDSIIPLPDQKVNYFRGYAITVGKEEEVKDFYVYDWVQKQTVTTLENEESGSNQEESEQYQEGEQGESEQQQEGEGGSEQQQEQEIPTSGTWYYLGSIDGKESYTKIIDSSDQSLYESGFGFISSNEVCTINQLKSSSSNLSSFSFKNKITRIKSGSTYINTLNGLANGKAIRIRAIKDNGVAIMAPFSFYFNTNQTSVTQRDSEENPTTTFTLTKIDNTTARLTVTPVYYNLTVLVDPSAADLATENSIQIENNNGG